MRTCRMQFEGIRTKLLDVLVGQAFRGWQESIRSIEHLIFTGYLSEPPAKLHTGPSEELSGQVSVVALP